MQEKALENRISIGPSEGQKKAQIMKREVLSNFGVITPEKCISMPVATRMY
jgi:hypothetical protein